MSMPRKKHLNKNAKSYPYLSIVLSRLQFMTLRTYNFLWLYGNLLQHVDTSVCISLLHYSGYATLKQV